MNSSYIFCALNVLIISQSVLGNIFSCQTNTDCPESSICDTTERTCKCAKGAFFNTDFSKCLTIPSGPKYECVDDKQCSAWIIGPSRCKPGNPVSYCDCVEGLKYVENKCLPAKGLNDDCSSDSDCNNAVVGGYANTTRALKCVDKKCQCNDGFYNRLKSDCRPISKENDKCMFDSDCPKGIKCIDMICTKNTKEMKITTQNKSSNDNFTLDVPTNLNCQVDSDCTITNSFCASLFQTCLCLDGYVFDKNKNQCILGLGQTCTSDEECVSHAFCNSGKCECQQNYINGNFNQKCFKTARRLGESCTHDLSCFGFGINSICVNYGCQCKEGFRFDQETSLCYQADSVNKCYVDEDCKGKGYFRCDVEHNTCVCMDKYHKNGEKCLPDIGTACDNNICDGDNVVCSQNVCSCEKGYVGLNSTACIKEVDNLNLLCTYDQQCDTILNGDGICRDWKCVCRDEYVFDNSTDKPACLRKKYVGDMCRTPDDCKVMLKGDHIVCRNSICGCDYGFEINDSGNQCVSNAVSNFSSLILIILTITFKYL